MSNPDRRREIMKEEEWDEEEKREEDEWDEKDRDDLFQLLEDRDREN